MALINTVTGYYGFTVDGMSGSTSPDNNGLVNKCIIAIVYPLQTNDVDFTISNNADDWAVKMGDGKIIPLKNPDVLFQNRDNSIVMFDMDEEYPSNSPCALVYRSDTAYFNIKNRTTSRPFEMNAITGHFAFTIDGYGGTPKGNGLVNRVMVTIPYPQMINTVVFEISDDPSHWGARMGDGTIIPLREPKVIATNVDNAVVIFTMDEWYPSNSPCIIVYRSEDAWINIKPADDDTNFYPIADIIDIPTTMISGQTIDLNIAKVMPFNASNQALDWSVVTGPGIIKDMHLLYASTGGKIKLRAIGENGLGENNAYTKTFTINVEQNVITIDAQPVSKIDAVVGKVNYEISVAAKSKTDEIKYQWYSNNVNSYTGATALRNETNVNYNIPSSLSKGNYYYFCELSSVGAETVRTDITHLYVAIERTGIKIVPRDSEIDINSERQLYVQQVPADSDMPDVTWESSNSEAINVDSNGKIKSNLLSGTKVTITAKTVDGLFADSIDVTTSEYHSVTDITNIKTEVGIGETYALNPIVLPTNATFNNITWSLISNGTTGATLTNGSLRVTAEGVLKIRATIKKGLTLNSSYSKEFVIRVLNKSFIPVTDVTLNNDMSKVYNVDEIVRLNYLISPVNSSNTTINFTVVSGPGIINSTLLSFTGQGTVKIKATVVNGKATGTNFTKEFTFSCSGEESYKEFIESTIEVNNVTVAFEHTTAEGETYTDDFYDPYTTGCNPMSLPYAVSPTFATNQALESVTVKSIQSKVKPYDIIYGHTTLIPDDFWSGSDWETENTNLVSYDRSTNKISCNTDSLRVSRYYKVILHFVIKDGIDLGVPFEKDVTIKISSTTQLPYIPLEDFNLTLPNPFRTYYPALITSFKYIPENATSIPDLNLDLMYISAKIPETEDECGVLIYKPTQYDLYHTIKPLKLFDWSLDTLYLYPYNPGIIKLHAIIGECTVEDLDNFDPFYPEKYYIEKDFEVKVLPPFVPVKNIENIPTQLPSNSSIQLSPEISTENGLDCYNPCWDEEISTYSDIVWSIDNSGDDLDSTGITITSDGVITIASTRKSGKFGIKATVASGTAERLEWYEKVQESVDYEQTFEIEVVKSEEDANSALLTLTLTDNTTVDIFKLSDIALLSTNLPETASITIDGKTFKKNQVKSIEFKNTVVGKEITSLRNFGKNFTKLTSLNKIPETVSGDSCLRNFLEGCTSFNQAITIPAGVNGKYCLKYFLRGCTSFNQTISILSNITGEGCMHGFLYGCTSFNKSITIPNTVTGKSCLERFLYGCTSFNQAITIPSGVSGYACMRHFLARCSVFNQPLTLPNDVGVFKDEDGNLCGRQLNCMLENCNNMCSTITVPANTGVNAEVSQRSFSSFNYDSPTISLGIQIAGPGANEFVKRLVNNYEIDENGFKGYPPYTHFRNLD